MIHIDRGGDKDGAQWFFDNLMQQQVDFDLIGLSYYPWWRGSIEEFRETLDTVYASYAKPVMLAETAYPWTLAWFDDTHNIVGIPEHTLPGYPATPEGQRDFLRDIMQMAEDMPGGLGTCYWEPAYVSAPGMGSPWKNVALFDESGEVLPAASALGGTLGSRRGNDTPSAETLQIYPNTAFVSYFQPPGSCARVRVMDLWGRVVAARQECTRSGSVTLPLSLRKLPSGYYTVVTDGTPATKAATLIVLR